MPLLDEALIHIELILYHLLKLWLHSTCSCSFYTHCPHAHIIDRYICTFSFHNIINSSYPVIIINADTYVAAITDYSLEIRNVTVTAYIKDDQDYSYSLKMIIT